MVPETWELLTLLHVACLTACLTVHVAMQDKQNVSRRAMHLTVLSTENSDTVHTYWTLSPSDQTKILSTYTWMAPGLLDHRCTAGTGLLDSHSIQDEVGTLALSHLFLQYTCSSSCLPL